MNTKSLWTIVAAMAVILLLPLPALADYHYASHTGSNEYPYTSWATAADSIQPAVDACSPHDTIYIGSGVWEQTILTYEDDTVSIIGAGMDSTIILVEPLQFTEAIRLDYNCSVQDLTVRRPLGGPGIWGMPYAGIRVTNCKIRATIGVDCYGYPSYITNCIMDSCSDGIDVIMGPYVEIKNNILSNLRGSVAGIELYTHAALVENNIIYCSPSAELNAFQGDHVYTDRIIRNNLIWNGIHSILIGAFTKHNNAMTGSDYGMSGNPQERIKNNSITNCWWGMASRDSAFINYNNFWNNQMDFQSVGPHTDTSNMLHFNPMYVSDRDFHLQMYSSLINAGDPTILDTDSSRSDIGAYGGPYGSSYPYQDLAPRTPDTIRGNYNQDTAFISWSANTEADFNHYLLYRDTVGGFIPTTANLIAQPETSLYIDLDVSNLHYYYYRVAAVDNQDNVSGYSAELVVITTDIWNQPGAELPQVTAISSNYPNPFNVSTVVVYRVANLGPQPAEIKIDIYDVVGRKVRTLVNQRKEAGEHRIGWDGKDDFGERLSSGVYFAKITQWGLELSGKPRKLMLIK